MANALLIWDNNKQYAKELCIDLGISYSDDVVFSMEELDKNKLLETKDCILLLLDTNIDEKRRTEFNGIEMVKSLRKDKRYNGLIVAYSTYPESYLKNRNDAKILFTSGTRLRQFTKKGVDVDEIESLLLPTLPTYVPKLSEDVLDDIHYNVFNTKGILQELLHKLKNALNKFYTGKNISEIVKQVAHTLDDYKKLLLKEIDPQKVSAFNKHFTALVDETKADVEQHWKETPGSENFKYANAGNQVDKFSRQIDDLAPKSNNDAERRQEENINWEVLFYDDTEDIRKIVQGYFNEKDVKCHVAASEKEVYDTLKENAPRISLFISDIRLEDEKGHWFDRQGYDVIDYLSQRNDYPLIYAVLTSKRGTINKMVQQRRKDYVQWFSKDDVINNRNSFNIFFEALREHAEDNFSSNNLFQPTGCWIEKKYKYKYPLKSYYRLHRQSKPEYMIIENSINKKVIEFIESIIPQYRGSIGEETFIQDWRCDLSESVIDEQELKKFRDNKLLGRRLILALGIFYDLAPVKIFEIMAGKKDDNGKNGTKQLFGQLALSQKLGELKEQIRIYTIGDKLPLLKEEYDFLKEEFIDEEFSNADGLNNDHVYLKKIVNDIKTIFDKKVLAVPPILLRVKYILDNEKVPKFERLNKMLSEIVLLDKDNNIINEIDNNSPFKQIKNANLKNLFLRHQFISF